MANIYHAVTVKCKKTVWFPAWEPGSREGAITGRQNVRGEKDGGETSLLKLNVTTIEYHTVPSIAAVVRLYRVVTCLSS